MADLVTRANLKIFLGIASGDTSQDSLLDLLISQCSARIEAYCGRVFASASYTDFYSGSGTLTLALRNRPVTAISSIYQDDWAYWGQASSPFAAATLLTAGSDYALVLDGPGGTFSKSGMVRRIGNIWTKPQIYRAGTINPQPETNWGNIKVTYTAGYSTVPADVQQATMLLCSAVKTQAPTGQEITSESYENYSRALAGLSEGALAGLPRGVLGALAGYRNLAIG